MSEQAESSKDEKNAQATSEQEVRSGLALTVEQEKVLGWVATFMAVCMYVAYIPQIVNNLDGHPGNPLQPLVAAINCSLWVYYGLFKPSRDLPLAAANAPGIFFGLAAFVTAL